jgi:hypothetical protein
VFPVLVPLSPAKSETKLSQWPTTRRRFNGLPAFGDDLVNIVVRPAAEADAARV